MHRISVIGIEFGIELESELNRNDADIGKALGVVAFSQMSKTTNASHFVHPILRHHLVEQL